MLVLARKINEQIVISSLAGEIRITLVAIRGDKVRLGFDAPKEVHIDRHQLHERIQREGRRSAGLGKPSGHSQPQ